MDMATGENVEVSDSRYRPWDHSPDGSRLAVTSGNELFTIDLDGSNPVKISDKFRELSIANLNNDWLPSDQIVFIAQEQNLNRIYVANPNDGELLPIPNQEGKALSIYPSNSDEFVFWEEGVINSAGAFSYEFWQTALNGSTSQTIDLSNPAFLNQDGQLFAAYQKRVDISGTGRDVLTIGRFENAQLIELAEFDEPLEAGEFIGIYGWLPSEEPMLFVQTVKSSGDRKVRNVLINREGYVVEQLPDTIEEIRFALAWSPDGQQMIYLTFETINQGKLRIFDRATRQVRSVVEFQQNSDLYITHFFWLP